MDDTYENMPCCGLNRGRACLLSRLDDVGGGVRLRARFANLADEDVNSTEGDPVHILNGAGLGALSRVIDVELAAAILVIRPMAYPLSPSKLPFKNSKPSCDSPTVGANYRGNVLVDVVA